MMHHQNNFRGNVTETTYVQQMLAKTDASNNGPCCTVATEVPVEETKYVTINLQSLELL
jgi:hypothetical protein